MSSKKKTGGARRKAALNAQSGVGGSAAGTISRTNADRGAARTNADRGTKRSNADDPGVIVPIVSGLCSMCEANEAAGAAPPIGSTPWAKGAQSEREQITRWLDGKAAEYRRMVSACGELHGFHTLNAWALYAQIYEQTAADIRARKHAASVTVIRSGSRGGKTLALANAAWSEGKALARIRALREEWSTDLDEVESACRKLHVTLSSVFPNNEKKRAAEACADIEYELTGDCEVTSLVVLERAPHCSAVFHRWARNAFGYPPPKGPADSK